MKVRARRLHASATRTRRRHVITVAMVCLLAGLFTTTALAAFVNIATPTPSSATIGNAIYEPILPTDASGSGVFDSFVRTQSDNNSVPPLSERGFNTDATPTYDAKNGSFTHSILLSGIHTISRNGTLYRECITDINQDNSSPNINLNDLELWLTLNGSITGYVQPTGFPTGANKRYELDAGGNNTILMSSNVGSGSGQGDYRLRVLASA